MGARARLPAANNARIDDLESRFGGWKQSDLINIKTSVMHMRTRIADGLIVNET